MELVLADHGAHLGVEVLVVGGGAPCSHRIGDALDAGAGEHLGAAVRAVLVGGAGLADALEGLLVVADKAHHVLVGELGEQGLPVGVVVVLAAQVDQLQVGGLTKLVCGHGGGVTGAGRVLDGLGHVGDLVGVGEVDGLGGEGASPVGAAQPGDGVELLHGGVLVGVDVIEEVLDLGAGRLGLGEGLVVRLGAGPGGNSLGVALGGHAVGRGLALGGQEVVHGLVRAVGHGKEVVASLEDVGLGLVGIVVGELGLLDVHGHVLGGAGGDEVGLLVAHELDGGHLDAVLAVVVGVGLLEVDGDGVLALHGAGVGHGHLDVKAVVGLGDAHALVVEGGVGQTVGEGIGHVGAVVEVAGVALAQDLVLVAGLIVAGAHVDALGVHVVAAPVGALVVGGLPLVDHALDLVGLAVGQAGEVGVDHAEVGHHGVEGVVLIDGVGQLAGGVDLAGEHLHQRVHGVVTLVHGEVGVVVGAGPHHGVHGVGPGAILPAGSVGQGEEDDHLGEGTRAAKLGHAVEHVLLLLGEGQVVAIDAAAVLVVGSLAAATAQGDDGHARGAVEHARSLDVSPGVLVDGHVGHVGVAVLQAVGVELPAGVVEVEAGALPGLVHGLDVLRRGVAEDHDLAVGRSQRECRVLVLEKDGALAHDVGIELVLVGGELLLALLGVLVVALEVLHVAGVGRGGTTVGRGGLATATCQHVGEACKHGRAGRAAQEAAPGHELAHLVPLPHICFAAPHPALSRKARPRRTGQWEGRDRMGRFLEA